MLTAALYGLLASSALLIGAVVGILFSPPRRVVASIVAFGSGVLVSALTFELMDEAFEKGSPIFVVGGFIIGAVIYVAASFVLDRMASISPKREGRAAGDVKPAAAAIPESSEAATVSGVALLVGAILDGVPENAAIGVSLRAEGETLGIVLLVAVFLGNLPESIGSSVGMRKEGRSRRYILGVWGFAAAVCTLASIAGYALLSGLSADMISAMLALAAGGILAMLADTMMPEAFEKGGPLVALATAVGFMTAFLLSHLTF